MTWNAGKRREFFLRHKTGWKWLDFFRIEFLHPVRHNFSPVGGMPAGAGNNPGCIPFYTKTWEIINIIAKNEKIYFKAFILVGILISVIAIVHIFDFDFTKFLEIALTLLICLILASIILTIFTMTGLLDWGFGRTAISAIGIVLFCLFLLIDIQLVMGGGKYEFSPEDYVIAALNIYLDLVNLFLHRVFFKIDLCWI